MSLTNTTIETLDESDYKYILDTPDEGFNPQRNAQNIKKAIDSGIEIEIQLRKVALKEIGERVDILSSFARNSIGKGHTQNLAKFLGKRRMAELYGDKLMEKIRIMESVQRLNKAAGNTIEGGKFFLT